VGAGLLIDIVAREMWGNPSRKDAAKMGTGLGMTVEDFFLATLNETRAARYLLLEKVEGTEKDAEEAALFGAAGIHGGAIFFDPGVLNRFGERLNGGAKTALIGFLDRDETERLALG
jgi:hypothetical protein